MVRIYAQCPPAFPAPCPPLPSPWEVEHTSASRLACCSLSITHGLDYAGAACIEAFSHKLPPIWAPGMIQGSGPSSSFGEKAGQLLCNPISPPMEKTGMGHCLSREHYSLYPLSYLTFFLITNVF